MQKGISCINAYRNASFKNGIVVSKDVFEFLILIHLSVFLYKLCSVYTPQSDVRQCSLTPTSINMVLKLLYLFQSQILNK